MLFNSHEFVFVFLPVCVVAFFALGRFSPRAAAAFLMVSSVVFYGWMDPAAVPILIASACLNFTAGSLLVSMPGHAIRRRRAVLTIAVTIDLLALAFYKYWDFMVSQLLLALGFPVENIHIVMPAGISFFTFTQIAFLVDAYRREAAEPDPVHYGLFVSYFPHLIAGPILHHKEMMPQFQDRATYRPQPHLMAMGLVFFTVGLAKKVLIADNIAPFSTEIFTAAESGEILGFFAAWMGSLSYTMQIYFDFSAYSDMAVGGALLFGIRLPLNFNSPYKSTNIIEFWRRWHMTLSRFLRDYLYYPLGGNRKGPVRRHLNLLIVMTLGGLWHGAGWTFLIWGLLHGLYLMVNHGWHAVRPARGKASRLARAASWLLTFVAVVVAWVFFRADSMDSALAVLRAMAGLEGFLLGANHAAYFGPLLPLAEAAGIEFVENTHFSVWGALGIMGCLAVCLALPNVQQWAGWDEKSPRPRLKWTPNLRTGLALGATAAAAMASISDLSEFLYFRF